MLLFFLLRNEYRLQKVLVAEEVSCWNARHLNSSIDCGNGRKVNGNDIHCKKNILMCTYSFITVLSITHFRLFHLYNHHHQHCQHRNNETLVLMLPFCTPSDIFHLSYFYFAAHTFFIVSINKWKVLEQI
jgi:hypothetical protein